MTICRARRPVAPAWSERTVRLALGHCEHRSPSVTVPTLGAVRLVRRDQRRPDGTWDTGAVYVISEHHGAFLEAEAVQAADDHREAADALAGMVAVARRPPGQIHVQPATP